VSIRFVQRIYLTVEISLETHEELEGEDDGEFEDINPNHRDRYVRHKGQSEESEDEDDENNDEDEDEDEDDEESENEQDEDDEDSDEENNNSEDNEDESNENDNEANDDIKVRKINKRMNNMRLKRK